LISCTGVTRIPAAGRYKIVASAGARGTHVASVNAVAGPTSGRWVSPAATLNQANGQVA
jgi:hypothetical protein